MYGFIAAKEKMRFPSHKEREALSGSQSALPIGYLVNTKSLKHIDTYNDMFEFTSTVYKPKRGSLV